MQGVPLAFFNFFAKNLFLNLWILTLVYNQGKLKMEGTDAWCIFYSKIDKMEVKFTTFEINIQTGN